MKASNPGLADRFGYSVALAADGNTLAVGAHDEDSSATGIDGNQASNNDHESGAVYVFTRNGTTWLQQAYVKPPYTWKYDLFGYSIALSGEGNTLAVGARGEGSNATGIGGNQISAAAASSGAVYLY